VSDRPSSRARIALAVGAGLAAALLYAGQFVISRWSFQRTLTPWDLAAVRFVVAGLLLLPVILRRGIADAAGIGWRRALVLAIIAGAPYTLIMYAGLALAPAAHGAVIITGGTPVVSTAIGWLWFGARPSPTRLVGLAVIVMGLVVVSWAGIHGGGGPLTWLGDLLFAVPTVMWGVFTVLARHWRVDPARGTAVVWVLALAYLPFYLAIFGLRLMDVPPGELVFQGLYQGLGVAIAALAFYAFAIRVLGVGVASLFMPLVPVFGVLLAIPVLAEIPTALQLVGMLGVSVGMVLGSGYTSSHSRRTSS
jgi:drug/metabolite transporter (DMT)-like permease